MSIFSKGIDAQVQQRMMQDPRRLQQSYKQNRNILDLIALQMIKSEKDQKKKDLALKMQQTPGTIKQQREQELFQQTKDDLIKQTAGILGVKDAQQKKNMRRLIASAGKGRPPMGGIAQPFNREKPKTPSMANPLATGLAKAPAQNMQGMTRRAAQGGIIGFQAAGSVPDTNNLNAENFSVTKPNAIVPQLTIETINELLDKEGGLGQNVQSAITGGLTGNTTTDAEERAKRLIGFSPEVTARYKELLDRRRDVGLAQLDPDKLRKQAIPQILAAMAGGTSLASAGRLGAQAGAQIREKQEGAALKQLTDEETSFRNMVGDIYGQKEKILGSVDAAADRDTQKFGAGLTAGTQILANQMNTLNDNARLLLDAKIADSDIAARYDLAEMRKNVELAIKIADVEVRAEIANLQADTELKARKYDTDVRAATSKELSKNQMQSSLQNTLQDVNRDIGTNDYNIRRIYESALTNLGNDHAVAMKTYGVNSPEAKAVMDRIKYYTDESLDSNGNPKGIIPKGLKVLNEGLIKQKKDINSLLSGITVQ